MDNPFDVLNDRLDHLERLLMMVLKQSPEPTQESDRWFNMDELCQYLNLKKQTIYGKISRREIPYYKNPGEKALRFLKSEIDAELLKGSVKSVEGIDAEATKYLRK